MDIFKHTAKKNKKFKRADQILPEVYCTTLKEVTGYAGLTITIYIYISDPTICDDNLYWSCHNGGVCSAGVHSFKCACGNGYAGPTCEKGEY